MSHPPQYRYSKDQLDEFQSIRRVILESLEDGLIRPSKDKRSWFLAKDLPRRYFGGGGKKLVQRAYALTIAGAVLDHKECENGLAKEGVVDTGSEAFWRKVVGQDRRDGEADTAVVKLLAILMFSDVNLDSTPWQYFVHLTILGRVDERKLFTDKDLLLLKLFKDREDEYAVDDVFGGDEKLNSHIYRRQYLVCAPVITKGHQSFAGHSDNIRLPWEETRELEAFGGSREVSKVRVADGYFNVPTNKGWLIKKVLDKNARDGDVAQQLWQNPKKISNVVEMYATFEVGGTTSILMECAECTLYDLMMHKKDLNGTRRHNGSDTPEKTLLLQKMLDLGHGLQSLHNDLSDRVTREEIKCIHGDIGPRNVLLVNPSEEGSRDFVLKISDFGISQLRYTRAGENGAPVHGLTKGEQCDYLPPECLKMVHQPTQDDRMDVYSFGCLLLDYVSWLWDCRNGHEGFRKSRKLFAQRFANQPQNYRFFEVCRPVQHPGNGEYNTTLWTEPGDVDVTIKMNKGVTHFFEKIRDDPDTETARERQLYYNIFKALREVALVPDPKLRRPMTEVNIRLKQVISDSVYGHSGGISPGSPP